MKKNHYAFMFTKNLKLVHEHEQWVFSQCLLIFFSRMYFFSNGPSYYRLFIRGQNSNRQYDIISNFWLKLNFFPPIWKKKCMPLFGYVNWIYTIYMLCMCVCLCFASVLANSVFVTVKMEKSCTRTSLYVLWKWIRPIFSVVRLFSVE